jgi:holo-[acyl-carrier protein] synthase
MSALRSGIDLIEIQRLADVNPAIRARFLQRVYTPGELEDSGGRFESLAGRFAAKEAVAKALGTGIGPIRWQDIEIRRGAGGAPQLTLHGKARTIAEHLGLNTWSVSISHGRTYATAIAVAIGPGVE